MSLKETEKEWWELLNLMNLILGLKEERGKRGRGAAGKKMSFWSFEKRRKSIYSKLFFPNCSKEALMPIRPRTANAIYHKYGRLESLWWTHFEWIWTPLKSFTVKMNLLEEMTYGIENLMWVLQREDLQNSTVAHPKLLYYL